MNGPIHDQWESVFALDAHSEIDSPNEEVGQVSRRELPTGRAERVFTADQLTLGYTKLRSNLGDLSEPIAASQSLVQAAVNSYLDGVFKYHDAAHADAVPLAPDAHRWENLRPRGASAAEIRAQLEAPTMVGSDIGYGTIDFLSMDTIDIEGNKAVANLTYWLVDKPAVATIVFTVDPATGDITQIKSVCGQHGGVAFDSGPGRRAFCGDSTTE